MKLLYASAAAMIVGSWATISVTPAHSQNALSPLCELHFWPTAQAQTSNYSGVSAVVGSVLAGKRMAGKDALLADLPPSNQVEAIQALDLRTLLRTAAPVKVVLENKSLPSSIATSEKRRLTQSGSPCYIELVVKRIGYRSHITAGRDFGAVFILRRYTTPTGLAKIAQGSADVQVKLYPSQTPEGRPTANAELKGKFGEIVQRFLLKSG